MPGQRARAAALALALALPACSAFYLPGVAPAFFERDDLVYFKARARAPRRCPPQARA
jgi:hypothetical protein